MQAKSKTIVWGLSERGPSCATAPTHNSAMETMSPMKRRSRPPNSERMEIIALICSCPLGCKGEFLLNRVGRLLTAKHDFSGRPEKISWPVLRIRSSSHGPPRTQADLVKLTRIRSGEPLSL